MNHQAIITDGCDSLARNTSFKAALMAILLVKQLTIDLPEGDNNIWIILHLLLMASHESRVGYCTGVGPKVIGPWNLVL